MQAVSPDGAFFVTGSKKGALHSYQIVAPQQQQLVPSTSDTKTHVSSCWLVPQSQIHMLTDMVHQHIIC